MPKIICTLENASDNINGVKFDLIPGLGRIADVEDESLAELFLSIPGYELVEDGDIPAATAAPAPKAEKPATAAAPKAPAKTPTQKKAAAPAPAPAPSEGAAAPDAAPGAEGEGAGSSSTGSAEGDDGVF